MAQAGTLDGRVSALEARTGDVLWSLDTGGGMVSSYQVSSWPLTILSSVSVASTALNTSTHAAQLNFLFSMAKHTRLVSWKMQRLADVPVTFGRGGTNLGRDGLRWPC